MKFLRHPYRPYDSEVSDFAGEKKSDLCILTDDNWDDFSFKTTFVAMLFGKDGKRHDLGTIKIISKGMEWGRVNVPSEFSDLGSQFCSLGGDRDYYLKLSNIDNETRQTFLRGIRDCIFDQRIWEEFKNERAMADSLLRFVSIRDVVDNFPRILRGDAKLTPYAFQYHFQSEEDGIEATCSFEVEPRALPPTNIHVIIGRNGSGKTRLLTGMADALTENKAASVGLAGSFAFEDKIANADTDFLNLVVVTYSVFDHFDPISEGTRRTKKGIPYQYVGIKKFTDGPIIKEVTLKSAEDLDDEFEQCFHSMLADGSRTQRWIRALEILESDPGICELDLSRSLTDSIGHMKKEVPKQFALLSSGHKIVLLTIARLVEFVSDRSLVLMDEPETHLHPPLLGSFIRALSDLLLARNGVAILATHSPVVLQEVPSTCVSILRRSGDVIRVSRPEIETFGENVSVLTRKVFGLEVEESGFFKLLRDRANDSEFAEVIDEFDGRVGSEGRALARAFTSKNESG